MACRSPAVWLTSFAVALLGTAAMKPAAAAEAPANGAPAAASPADGAGLAWPAHVPLDRGPVSARRHDSVDAAGHSTAGMFDRPITLIELPREVRLGAPPERAHHALGFRSSAAENWLRGQGIGAKTCYLPMLRLPARITPSGDASIAFWVYARCSFY